MSETSTLSVVHDLPQNRTTTAEHTTPSGPHPAVAAPAAPMDAPVGLADFKVPWVTCGLLAVMVVIFVLENALAVLPGAGGTPHLLTLIAFGSLNGKAVWFAGQWYRLFTAPLLHASVAHILGNGVALLMGGWLLEGLVGRLWFLALFVIGALGGSLMSSVVGAADITSVGASGAIMALFAALWVSSLHLPIGSSVRTRIQIDSARMIIPSLLPLFATAGVRIDYGAHVGGAIGGALAATCLLEFWPPGERIPGLRRVAMAVSIAGALAVLVSATIVVIRVPTYRALAARMRPGASPPRDMVQGEPFIRAQAVSGAGATPADVVSDHGPGRVACDLQWSKSPDHTAAGYADFLRACLKR